MNGTGSTTATGPYLWTAGIPRPDHGPDMWQLVCDQCGAGWVGPAGEACYWCERSLTLLQELQARLVIQAPSVDVDDARYVPVMNDWRHRLQRAVTTELITRQQAERAWTSAARVEAA